MAVLSRLGQLEPFSYFIKVRRWVFRAFSFVLFIRSADLHCLFVTHWEGDTTLRYDLGPLGTAVLRDWTGMVDIKARRVFCGFRMMVEIG